MAAAPVGFWPVSRHVDAPGPRPLPVVGMIGAGQLARMTHQAAIALGQSLRVLAADPADPAALVCADVWPGTPGDLPALQAFARGCAAVTFDHEQVPPENLHALVEAGRRRCTRLPPRCCTPRTSWSCASGWPGSAWPCPSTPPCTIRPTSSGSPPRTAGRLVLKAVRGGYDGRGVWLLAGADPELVAELLAAGTPLMVERAVSMRRELAALVARSPFGQAAAWPVVETVQADGQCVQVLAPAPGLDPDDGGRRPRSWRCESRPSWP